MARPATARSSPATATPPPDASGVTRRHIVVLAAIVVAAVAARVYHLDEFSMWLDEIWTIETATGLGSPHTRLPQNVIIEQPPSFTSLDDAAPWWRIWTGMGEVTHPPLYVILLRWWMELFGTGSVAVRALSVLASVATVVLMFDVVRILRDPDAGLWAATIMALAGTQIQFAQEARPYAVMVALALAATAALVRIERHGATRGRLLAFGAAILALMLTHYFAAGTAASLVAHGLLRTKGAARRRLVLTVGVAAAVFILAWGPSMWTNRGALSDENAAFLRDDDAPGHVLRTLERVAGIPVRLLSEYLDVSVAAVVAGLVIVAAAAYRGRRFDDLLLWTAWLTGSIGLVFVLDLARGTQHLYLLRYTYLASPAMCAIVATLLWDARGWFRHVLPGLVLASGLLVLHDSAASFFKGNWRDLARELRGRARPGDVLVIAGNSRPYAGNAYLCLSYYIPPADRPAVALVTERADPALVERLKAAPGVILLAEDYALDAHVKILGECTQTFILSAPGIGDTMRITW